MERNDGAKQTPPTRLVGVTGGIGSGKSVVCRILEVMGYEVYDCDTQAKRIMDGSDTMQRNLVESFGAEVVANGNIDRQLLARIVFNDRMKLLRLNEIVHGAVIDDIVSRRAKCRGKVMFVETAILHESGLDRIVDEIWEVTAPEEVRIERVMQRNGMSREEVIGRINSQRHHVDLSENTDRTSRTGSDSSEVSERRHVIVNDGCSAVLPRVLSLLESGNVTGS